MPTHSGDRSVDFKRQGRNSTFGQVLKKLYMPRYLFIFIFCFLSAIGAAQYTWKLEKDNNGIKVFSSEMANSSFKAVKVECILEGNYQKLLSVLSNVPKFSEWIYRTELTKMVRKPGPGEFIYYSLTNLPWPMSNRDVVIRVQVKTDSMPAFMVISGVDVPDEVEEIPTRVRVKHYKAYWKVSMPTAATVKILYILELDPGGTVPAWIANMFVDKGPYETFVKLAEQLKK
jgi:hypothetical protein